MNVPAEIMAHEKTAPAMGDETIRAAPVRATPDVELRSLFSLLDDPDERVARAVMERILQRGHACGQPSEILSPLTEFAKDSRNPLAQSRAEAIATQFNAEGLAAEFEALNFRLARGAGVPSKKACC